jgi:protoporphyrinogen oxidase
MGYFVDGTLYPWGDPVSLLTFPKLSLIDKLRYGLMMFASTKRRDWSKLETVSAKAWITAWCGRRVYDRLWRRLFDLKFFEYADDISAAWIWTRIKRVGTSRRSLMQEELGYIEGGSETLVHALVEAIEGLGGKVVLNAPATRIDSVDGRVTGVQAGGERHEADAVICTCPTPLVSALVPDLPAADRARYDAIPNIGVVCVVFRLKRRVTGNFWLNVADERLEIPGLVEFSNLRPTDDAVVYIPYYMPVTHPKFAKDDAFFREEGLRYLRTINPEVVADDVVAFHVGRLKHAQPVCPPGFLAMIPPVQTAIEGLQIADTCFYYPEDRGVSEGARLAKDMAERIG